MRRNMPIILILSTLYVSPGFSDTARAPAPAARLTAAEGLVDVRPENAARWTPAEDRQEILPGDELRCGARGPNAAALSLADGGEVILGPGGLLRVEAGGAVHLADGELVVMTAGSGTPSAGVWRFTEGGLKKLAKEPAWLDGYHKKNPREVMGALLAEVDGREVSLSLGYHKVTVDVRDQIARTVIEESFVNHTDEILEGVFQFPLPQDASISNFGMWVGDRLVEADVVEKRRAREIYETIKREKRDPGLLEWAGGSLFKARVYPIPAHSEKRVTITYTQVLPLRRGTWAYDYSLQSDLLRAHPLRILELDLRIHSDAGLAEVTCPTHPARVERTAHGARVRFEAQEYRPDRDFRVVVTPRAAASGIRTVTHRRGEDGYFMVLFQPPEAAAHAGRMLLPDGEPLELLIMADTSGSMGPDARASQAAFLRILLGALRPADRFRLAACDTSCVWADPDYVAADDRSRARALSFLAARESLGWTDLDALVDAALAAARSDTHVVYVGDGRHSAGDADTAALAARIAARSGTPAASIHAVAPGSLAEPPVMAALAALGGGSFRRIRDGDGPRTAARELLREILVPGVRDVRVAFEGFRTAKVYPESLPNLAAGTQHVVVGRYRPGDEAKSGRVVIRGRTADGDRTWAEDVTLADAEWGNSFLPRLWARRYLDELLGRGADAALRDRIVGFSQEFRIMTPFTSFLVLESDADRRRFGVERHFQMRDGEEFFSKGRAAVDFALARKAIKKAGAWRTRLQRLVLASMRGMGRGLTLLPDLTLRSPMSSVSWDYSEAGPERARGWGGLDKGIRDSASCYNYEVAAESTAMGADVPSVMDGLDLDEGRERAEESEDGRFLPSAGEILDNKQRLVSDEMLLADGEFFTGSLSGKAGRGYKRSAANSRQTAARMNLLTTASLAGLHADAPPLDQAWWFQRVAGYLHEAPQDAPAQPAPKPAPEALRELSRRLYRGDILGPDAGLEIRRMTRTYSPAKGTRQFESDETAVLAGTRWIHRQRHSGSDGRLAWCDGREYVAALLPFDLGWRRAAKAVEGTLVPLNVGAFHLSKLEDSYRDYTMTVTRDDPTKVILRWSPPDAPDGAQDVEVRMLVDETRGVVLESTYAYRGAPATRMVFNDFVQVRGAWWPGRTVTFDGEGRKTAETKLTYRALDAAGISKAVKDAAGALSDAVLFRRPLPAVDEARERALAGTGSGEDLLTLLLADGLLQRWGLVLRHLDALDRLRPGAPGLGWLRLAVEVQSRRHQQVKDRVLALADASAMDRGADAWDRARYLMEQGPQVLQANEVVELLDRLAPVYSRLPEWNPALRTFGSTRVSWLRSAGRIDEADETEAALFLRYPNDYGVVQQYAWSLRNRGDFEGACRVLRAALEDVGPLEAWEESALRNQWAQILSDQGRLEEALELVGTWMTKDLDQAQLYDQYLSLLVRTGRRNKAGQVVRAWVAEGVDAPATDAAATARLQSSVNLMLGQGYMLYTYTVEKEWIPVLTDLAVRLGADVMRSWLVTQIISHQGVHSHGADRVIRKAWLRILREDMATLAPAAVRQMAGQISGGEPALPAETWEALARAASERMDAARAAQERHVWSDVCLQLLSSHADLADEAVRFLRERYEWTDDRFRAANRDALFHALLGRPWSRPVEEELLTLALTLANDVEVAAPWQRIGALQIVTDWMVRGRETEDDPRSAHSETAEALLESDGPSPLHDWIAIEVSYHEILAGKDPGPIASRCGKMLDRRSEIEHGKERASRVFRERLVVTLEYLATRRDASPALAEALLARIDRALEAHPKDRYWRTHKARLLMALDRPEALETALRGWLRDGGSAPAWRRTLGYLLAETGDIEGAVVQFEALRGTGQLSGREWSILADWYLVEGRREDCDAATLERFLAMPEHELSNLLYMKTSNTGVNGMVEVDDETLGILTALFRKSQYPANYLWQLQSLFQQTREPRLLQVLAEGLLGHSPGRVYPVLENVGNILNQIQDEASIDAVVTAAQGVRRLAESPVDRRALDLLIVAGARRGADLINQPGPHGEEALAALARASKGVWLDGERRLMAGFLAGMGATTWDELAKAQRQSLTTLLDGEAAGSEDHLVIASHLANVLWGYGKQAGAIRIFRRALDSYLEQRDRALAAAMNTHVETLIGYLEAASMHGEAESILKEIEARAPTAGQRWWARNRILGVHVHALQAGAATSLGAGAALYAALRDLLDEELASQPSQNATHLVMTLTGMYYAARDRRVGNAAADLRRFVRDRLPAVLASQTNDLQNIVGIVADCLHTVAGAREALGFLIERIEQEPDWYVFTNQSAWSWHGYRLGDLRRRVYFLGALKPRLFAVVASQLRRELETRRRLNAAFYHRSFGEFWTAKTDAFVAVTREVLAENPDDGPLIEYAAQYLWEGLDRRKDAVSLLADAWGRDLLSEQGRRTLADYLFSEALYGEALPVLRQLLELHPRDLHLLAQLLEGLCRTGRKAAFRKLLAATRADFEEDKAWNWQARTGLAGACGRCGAWTEAAGLFEAGIDGYLEAGLQQPRGDPNLSAWYQGLADACAGLGDTVKAVDAAGAAVVAWGPNRDQRQAALGTLRSVLEASKDLDGFVRAFESEVEETGLENPTVRRALGQVFVARSLDADALRQFEAALEVSPWDPELWDAAVEIHRRGGRFTEAAEARLGACRARPVDFACWGEAAALYAEAGDAASAERARTSIVEAAPDEADAHEALARQRSLEE